MAAYYLALKNAHIALAAISLAGFVLRFAWLMRGSARMQTPWVRIAPHVVDTLLLLGGVGLAVTLRQYPFVHGWLTAKILGLIAYIAFGTLALKRAPTRAQKWLSFVMALVCFAYIAGAAIRHSPASWWALAR
jgi:uncharacterized membrane protein SirB2